MAEPFRKACWPMGVIFRATVPMMAAMLAAGPAGAGAPSPVCASPDVLDRVAQRLAERNLYTRIDPRTVSEAPGPSSEVVRCGIYAEVAEYDTPRLGPAPLLHREAHGYVVRTRPNGFVLLSVD